jgi:hypothetical protein
MIVDLQLKIIDHVDDPKGNFYFKTFDYLKTE